MGAHVLLNLLNELGKRDKMRGLPSILYLFRNEFNQFNNARAQMLNSIYHMIKIHFCHKNVMILSFFTQRCYGRHNVPRKSINHLGDNCIQIFHLGRYIVGYTVGNLVLRRRASGAVKRDFRTYIRRYTSPNENFEYDYPHSNALL